MSVDEGRKCVFVAFRVRNRVRKLESRSHSCDPVQRSRICTSDAFDID